MLTFKQMHKRLLPLLMGSLFLSLALAGCGKTGKLDEGDCKCTVSFVDIPKELSMLEENVQKNFSISLTLKNIINEKLYHITLNHDNSFQQEISLNPGVYEVYKPYASQSGNTGITMAADVESVELTADKPSEIHVFVENTDEFTKHWMSVQPMPEMILAEKFDGQIQINRKIVDLRADNASDLIAQLNITFESQPNQVPAYGKIEVSDGQMGVRLTLQNQSDAPADWHSCKLIGIYVFKNNVVFPKGVTLGMSPDTVCHNSDGLYGEPDAFTRSLLYGWGFDNTHAIYKDAATGDKITVNLGSDNSSIQSIRYELAQFE
mgnify:CR=1 FL=1